MKLRGLLYRKIRDWWNRRKEEKEEKPQPKEQTVVTQPDWSAVDTSEEELRQMSRGELLSLSKTLWSNTKDFKKSLSHMKTRIQQLEAEKKEKLKEEQKKQLINEILQKREEQREEKLDQIKDVRTNDIMLGVNPLPKWLLDSDHALPNFKYFYGWREEENEDGKIVKIPLVIDNPDGEGNPKPIRNIEVENERQIFESKAGIIGQYQSGIIHTDISISEDGLPILLGEENVEKSIEKEQKKRKKEQGGNMDMENMGKLKKFKKGIQQLSQRVEKLEGENQQLRTENNRLNDALEQNKMALKNVDEQSDHWKTAAMQIFENQTNNTSELADIMGIHQDQIINRLLSQQQAKISSDALHDMRETLSEILPKRTEEVLRKKIMDEIEQLKSEGGNGGLSEDTIKGAIKSGYKEAFQEVMQKQQQQAQAGG